MKKYLLLFIALGCSHILFSQDLSIGLVVNDTSNHPMQALSKPAYLGTAIDPSFGTTIRRITNAGVGNVIVPMYSTIQAWNANETRMIVYNQSISQHQLLDGMTYTFIRTLSDISPMDLEQIFWDFNDPNFFYYPESGTNNFIKYNVNTLAKQILFNFNTISGYTGSVSLGNDVQMMSWDSDVVGFRCGNDSTFNYKISTSTLTKINLTNVQYTAPMPAPSGNLFYHTTDVYNASGSFVHMLNESATEHSCLGKLSNGNDAHFAIAFAQGPLGGCIGDIIAHDLGTGVCYPIISQSQGYNYPQSGTHISSLAHKNTEGGWLAASMIGYNEDGQSLLDQELVIAKADSGNIKVCRIGHHRSDEDQFNYWGEPHATISPSGTRVLFGSDWSGAVDGQSIDCYVVELPSFTNAPLAISNLEGVTAPIHPESNEQSVQIYPSPSKSYVNISWTDADQFQSIKIFNTTGKLVRQQNIVHQSKIKIDRKKLVSGIYYYILQDEYGFRTSGKIIFN